MTKRILIMAGGTGGHVFPALAVADSLRAQGHHVEWLGTARGIEASVVPEAGITLNTIQITGLRGKGKLSLLKAPFKLVYALGQALAVVKRINPDVVLGMGGFASGPGGLAARILGIPLVIHEQNAICGMTNKLLAKIANQVLEAFGGAFPVQVNTRVVGNPVRGGILDVSPPAQRWAEREGALRVLVVGGSLGAKHINDAMPVALASIPEEKRPQVWHQTGQRTHDQTLATYQQLGVENSVSVVAFIKDMAKAYAWADLIICRAGALTVSELAIAGVPSVLVPFPFAVDDHQRINGEYLEKLGAGIVINQDDLSAERLAGFLTGELGQREQLLKLAENARKFGRPEASQTVASVCLELVK
ncbi:MAG: undecaprenyldiphospho-muramoylpentapeptide beta-N-acetylglucosaminyltransferase [Pontibacterium sp.]